MDAFAMHTKGSLSFLSLCQAKGMPIIDQNYGGNIFHPMSLAAVLWSGIARSWN